MDEKWRDSAVCAGVDPELFFPEIGQPARAARRICASCPVQTECLETALRLGDVYGIWGNTSRGERRVRRMPSQTRRDRDDNVASAQRLRTLGRGIPQIAQQLGVSTRTVHRLLAKNDESA